MESHFNKYTTLHTYYYYTFKAQNVQFREMYKNDYFYKVDLGRIYTNIIIAPCSELHDMCITNYIVN